MAWTVEFTFDQNWNKGTAVLNLVAVWNKGLADEFLFPSTLNATDVPARAQFVAQAKAALARKTAPVPAGVTTLINGLTTALNA